MISLDNQAKFYNQPTNKQTNYRISRWCQELPVGRHHMIRPFPAVSAENKPYADAFQYS